MAFSVYEVVCVARQLLSWFVFSRGRKKTDSDANDFVNAKSNARKKLLLAG